MATEGVRFSCAKSLFPHTLSDEASADTPPARAMIGGAGTLMIASLQA
jgi:hypothetical protein